MIKLAMDQEATDKIKYSQHCMHKTYGIEKKLSPQIKVFML